MPDSKPRGREAHGITDADRARIAAYLRKPAHSRTSDDLRRERED